MRRNYSLFSANTLNLQDCGSFAGAINWVDCNEGPDSCYAYVQDDCLYTGDRIGEWGVGIVLSEMTHTFNPPRWYIYVTLKPPYLCYLLSSEEDEPSPGDVGSIESCRLWAELWMDDGAAFFHYNSTSEECHLYRSLVADCESVGGPKDAPSFEQCTATTTPSPSVPPTPTETTTTTTTTTTGSENRLSETVTLSIDDDYELTKQSKV